MLGTAGKNHGDDWSITLVDKSPVPGFYLMSHMRPADLGTFFGPQSSCDLWDNASREQSGFATELLHT